jgi:hypothetical protein
MITRAAEILASENLLPLDEASQRLSELKATAGSESEKLH